MFYFFSRDKKNVCFKVGAKKKNCVLIFQKKNITESNNLAPPPEIKWCVPKYAAVVATLPGHGNDKRSQSTVTSQQLWVVHCNKCTYTAIPQPPLVSGLFL